ncbi:hypothetical protein QOZ80_5AG0373000 [Eleusine coracana subsp. coracana]|nr:hypothetical protein QOZ80_5AG0373000 [Eleusine coracana subsp. coracana]
MDSARTRRLPLKFSRPDWKAELRTNCLRRVRNDRINLLWKFRVQELVPTNDMKKAESEVRNIISDELQKLKHSAEEKEDQEMDLIWEYQEPPVAWPAEIGGEDVLLEMERLLYEYLREESIRKELEALDEEDAYLAQAVFEHMQLNDMERSNGCYNRCQASGNAKVWCPVCKQGELRDTHNLIYCTSCTLRLDLREDKITLEFLQERLGKEEGQVKSCKQLAVTSPQIMKLAEVAAVARATDRVSTLVAWAATFTVPDGIVLCCKTGAD